MVTLTDQLKKLNEEVEKAEKIEKYSSGSKVFIEPSGSKNIKVKFNIGGNFKNIKKVSRNPAPTYGISNFEGGISGVTGSIRNEIKAAQGVVNIKRATKIFNKDTKPVMAETVDKVYGMVLCGGKGVRYAAGEIKKLEEMKVTKIVGDD